MYRHHPYRGSRGAGRASGTGAPPPGGPAPGPIPTGGTGATPPGAPPPTPPAATPPSPPPGRAVRFYRAIYGERSEEYRRAVRWALYLLFMSIFVATLLQIRPAFPRNPSPAEVWRWTTDNWIWILLLLAIGVTLTVIDLPSQKYPWQKSMVKIQVNIALFLLLGALGTYWTDSIGYTGPYSEKPCDKPALLGVPVNCLVSPVPQRVLAVITDAGHYELCVWPERDANGTEKKFQSTQRGYLFKLWADSQFPVTYELLKVPPGACPRYPVPS